ncbi:MAG: DNA primase [Thermodesulfovibrionales bacterium]
MKFEGLLEEIKNRLDIIDVVSEYVQLKRSGQNFKALCPFHFEKTPSFMVSPSKQIFHCFGCGIGGDIVTFVMKYENISFSEALRRVAKKAGIDLRELKFEKEDAEKREKIYQINKEAMKFFINNLKLSETSMTYLRKRDINEESIKNFFIGYAASERDSLIRHLKKRGYDDSIIKDAGLAASDEKGIRDIFRERIIFPIFNTHNDVIGFGGRVLNNSFPKYLNTPETDIFKKGESLFGLNLAKEEIRKKGYSIIVEGYIDTIICHQYGFKNTIAPLGTALTPKQLLKLKQLTNNIILVFDSDDAGVSAAKRSLSIIFENNLRAKFLLLPEGEDPDSFLRKKGSQAFMKMVSDSMSLIEFLFLTSKQDKIDTTREALNMITHIKDLIIADELLVELSDRSRINEIALRDELKKLKKKARLPESKANKKDKRTENKEEYLLLSAIISFPEKVEYVLSRLDLEVLHNRTLRSLFEKIKNLGIRFNINSILDEADDEEKPIITELSLKPGFDPENVDKLIDDCLQVIAQKGFEEKMRQAEESGDVTLLNLLLEQKRKLLKGQFTH